MVVAMHAESYERGFLPSKDPASTFTLYPELNCLNAWGQQLPTLLQDPQFRHNAREWVIPSWPDDQVTQSNLAELHLYYLRLAFIASGYINQIGQPKCKKLPANIAQPLIKACELLGRPSILSYDGYALYNWYRLDSSKPIELGNIDTLQNFVTLYDEHWFILVHVAIEALAGEMINSILTMDTHDPGQIDHCLQIIESTLHQQIDILKRIPEHMSSQLYFDHFRPYIGFFQEVTYEGKLTARFNYRGETGAQSSLLPLLTAFLKIPHEETELTTHLNDMCNYMPVAHRQLITRLENLESIKPLASTALFNRVLETMAQFREQHFCWAKSYIAHKTQDPKGTGGTPYYRWLNQLIDETRQFKIKKTVVQHNSLNFVVGDITQLNVQAIVRPASRNVYKGRGVSETIFEKAGPQLKQACQAIGRAQTGEAVITPGFNLMCDAVIHTVPPHYSGGDHWGCQSLSQLKACYENTLKLALKHNIESLAFVSLGTGGNQFPHTLAAQQALEVLLKYQGEFQNLIVCLAKPSSLKIWLKAYDHFHYQHAA